MLSEQIHHTSTLNMADYIDGSTHDNDTHDNATHDSHTLDATTGIIYTDTGSIISPPDIDVKLRRGKYNSK